MRSRLTFGRVMLVAALLFSAIPAALVDTLSAQATSRCDWAQFIADVTVPDGTRVSPGTSFTKTWRLKNIGTCTWTTAYALVFSSGSQMGGSSPLSLPGMVAPGQTVDVTISLTAPNAAGHYIGYWKFKNASGVPFGIGSTADKAWWVEINVAGSSSPAGVAYDFAANYCSASWTSSQGSLPCSGSDGDPRGFVMSVNQPKLENGTTDPGVGLLTVPQDVYHGDIHGAYSAFHVEAGDHFQSIVSCAYGATNCDVTFRLDYQIGSGPVNTFWSFGEKYDGLFSRADVDLSSLAGQDVQFTLTVLAAASGAADRALWVNPAITRAGSPPPAPGARKFDFGTSTSPVAAGYVRVTETTAYVAGTYGWTTASNAESRDRPSQPDPLKRDLVMSGTSAPTFKVDLPNGNYAVTVTMGDQDAAHDNMVVKANGKVMLADVDTAAGAFSVQTFTVAVVAGSLTLQFLDAGGVDSVWVVNGISIASSSQPPTACDRAQFVADVTVPDRTSFAPGATFTKTWRLKNVGTCTWRTSYALIFDSGEKMGGPDLQNLPQSVAPGQTVDVSVSLTAPGTAGSYRGYWKFQNADGVPFGIGSDATKSWWVDIRVSGSSVHPAGCDRAQFVSDVTVPDGTVLAPGVPFTKTWRLKNAGTCTWTASYAMVFTTGERMGGPSSVNLPRDVAPGSTIDLAVSLTAPTSEGTYRGYWAFQNADGVRFGTGSDGTKSWWVEIKVSNAAVTPTPGLIVRGYVRLPDGSGLSGVTMYRSFASYDGVIVAKTDANGYFQSDFAFIPGDEQVRVWPSAPGYTFNPDSVYWRHYYGPEDRTFSFVVSPASGTPTSTPTGTLMPTDTPTATGAPTSTPTATGTPTSTPTPTPIGTVTDTSSWSTYLNGVYSFSFKFPPGSAVVDQTDTGGRLNLPFTHGTNLLEKHLDVSIIEGASTCRSPQSQGPSPRISTENVTFNGIPFLKEMWTEGATSHRGDFTAYSTAKGNACISLTFWLWSVVPEVVQTPPPRFDPVAETAVYSAILSSFAYLR